MKNQNRSAKEQSADWDKEAMLQTQLQEADSVTLAAFHCAEFVEDHETALMVLNLAFLLSIAMLEGYEVAGMRVEVLAVLLAGVSLMLTIVVPYWCDQRICRYLDEQEER